MCKSKDFFVLFLIKSSSLFESQMPNEVEVSGREKQNTLPFKFMLRYKVKQRLFPPDWK